jgi:protein TonB
MAGVLEVFSSRPQAFGEPDELTLEALSGRILKNLEEGSAPFVVAEENFATPHPLVPPNVLDSQAGWASRKKDEVGAEVLAQTPRSGLDVITLALGVVVVACAVLLGTLLGFRLGWRRTADGRGQVTNSGSGRAAPLGAAVPSSDARAAADAGSTPASSGTANSTAAGRKKEDALKVPVSGPPDSALPAGSLRIYENGREVFRMSPAEGQSDGVGRTATYEPGVERASKVEQAPILEVSPEVAEGSLLHRVEPDYPEEARQQQIQGTVVLDVRTGRDGVVQEVKLISGQSLLAEAAIAAVKQWRFKPRTVKAEPVEMQTTVTLNFQLPR